MAKLNFSPAIIPVFIVKSFLFAAQETVFNIINVWNGCAVWYFVESMMLLILGLFDEYKVQKTIWNRNLL